MRTLPRYIILSYIGPFLMTFFIAVFVLFMQWMWKYVDDLIGKGLETHTLVELFCYVTLASFPLALPLAVLLSSLMTFGNLGEHFELVALKSSGMSLQKIMSPLIIVAIMTSAGAFFFANNVLPFINLKMNSLINDIQQKKPAFNIKEGVFYNGIDGYTIRIEKKDRDGITCHNMMIYDHSANMGNIKVTLADSGKLALTDDKQFLSIDLFNGINYEEVMDTKNPNNHPFSRSKFKEQTVKFDLSGFRLKRSDASMFRTNYEMLSIGQINKTIDSINTDKATAVSQFKNAFSGLLSGENIVQQTPSAPLQQTIQAATDKARVIDMALNIARSKKYSAENYLRDINNYDQPIIYLSVEWHKKFSLSLACLVLFFVGAPLGAIIRKGGLGMPVVVSVIIFILFWVISITGEKMAQEGVFPAYIGMWIATAVIAPLGLFLTVKATSDSSLLDADAYLKFFRKLLWRKN
ncbi:MAG: LptF/LptG family permease [Bacteroidia bacterium]